MKSSNSYYQIFNPNCNSVFLVLCDHATNYIPKFISKTRLGLKNQDLKRHIAFDIGAKDTAVELSKNLKATLISSNFSRLIIDPNRSLNDPTSIRQIYDGTIISGNCNLSSYQIQDRKKFFYDPYHQAINNHIKKKFNKKLNLCLVSIHSFTPQLNLQRVRPWHIGVLFDQDVRMSSLVINELAKYKDICVGENKPYSGNLKGDTLAKHGTSNNIPHVLLEIRNDLIANKRGQKKWGQILTRVLNDSMKKFRSETTLK